MGNEPKKRPNVLFTLGAILAVIGASVATFATFFLFFFYLIPLWTFLLGIILIWFSKKKVKTKVLWVIIPITVFFTYQFLLYQFTKVPPETFLIPEDFRGKIHIHFNETSGGIKEVENGRRLYKIPNSGILFSQFSDEQGFIDQQYYLISKSGKRTELPNLDVRDYNEEWTTEKNPNEPSRNILGVFHAGRVSAGGSYEFYVATYQQLKDSFGFHYDKWFDSREQRILDSCEQINSSEKKVNNKFEFNRIAIMDTVTSIVEGTVLNLSSRKSLHNVKIELINRNMNYYEVTDSLGQFKFNHIASGTYDVMVSYSNFKTIYGETIHLGAGDRSELKISIEEWAKRQTDEDKH